MTKKLIALLLPFVGIISSYSQTKPKQLQYMPGINNKKLNGTITNIFYTTRWNKQFKWLAIGNGDTLVHVWPKDSEKMVIGQTISITGIKNLNQNLGLVLQDKTQLATVE